MTVTAVEKLSPSQLSNQLELTADDLDLDELVVRIAGKPGIDIRSYLTDGSVDRTIQGASTLTVQLEDAKRSILASGYVPAEKVVPIQKGRKITTSGYLAAGADVQVDGLWFRLKGPRKQGNQLTLLFEDREVALLRSYPRPGAPHNGFKVWPADRYSRAQVAFELVREVAEVPIRFICPALAGSKPITSSKDLPDANTRKHQRAFGFQPGVDVTVKNAPASPSQLHVIDAILQVGVSLGARRKVLVAGVMTITQESDAGAQEGHDPKAVGAFQQNPDDGWPATGDPAADAYAFFEAAIGDDKKNPNLNPGAIAQDVQASGHPDAYNQWRTEAEHTVSQWGVSADPTTPSQKLLLKDGAFQFTRGSKQVINGRTVYTREDNWTALGRLASEVGWRSFCVSGTVYFITDEDLFASAPRMTIDEDSDGVDAIDFDYTEGKKQATVTVSCRIGRWQAPPGSVVAVENMGPINGRWLVNEIERKLFTPDGTITLAKPQPILPESDAPEYALGSGSKIILNPTVTATGAVDGNAVAQAALRAISQRADYRYEQIRPMPASLFTGPFPIRIDCSAFATLCYKAADAPDPNNLGYNGAGNTTTLWANGTPTSAPQPGDLAFYGRMSNGAPSHVAVYLGDGNIANMGGPGEPIQLRVTDIPLAFRGYRQYNPAPPPSDAHHHRDGTAG